VVLVAVIAERGVSAVTVAGSDAVEVDVIEAGTSVDKDARTGRARLSRNSFR
jgi:hypothetical protein